MLLNSAHQILSNLRKTPFAHDSAHTFPGTWAGTICPAKCYKNNIACLNNPLKYFYYQKKHMDAQIYSICATNLNLHFSHNLTSLSSAMLTIYPEIIDFDYFLSALEFLDAEFVLSTKICSRNLPSNLNFIDFSSFPCRARNFLHHAKNFAAIFII